MSTEQPIEKTERRLFTYEERKAILQSSSGKCACCGMKLTTRTMTVEHIIPIYRGGTNDAENLTALCETCNKDKGDILYLPRSFYSAMIGTPRVNQMDDMVRKWFQTYKQYHDIERYPLIAPQHNFILNPISSRNRRPNFKLPYNRQLIVLWKLVRSEDYEEMEAISGTDLMTVRKFLERVKPDADQYDSSKQHYEIYKPVTFYALRKLSNDKLLAIFAIRYDKDKKDMAVYIVWTDMTKTAISMITEHFISCAFDATTNIAGEEIDKYIIFSYKEEAFDYYKKGIAHGTTWHKAELSQYKDTITNEILYTLMVHVKPNQPPMCTSDYIDIPKWLEYQEP